MQIDQNKSFFYKLKFLLELRTDIFKLNQDRVVYAKAYTFSVNLKMMLLRKRLLLALLLLNQSVIGQKNSIQPLKIGDRIPNLPLRALFDSSEKEIRINDLRGKLIILDFWDVTCAPCIAAMPQLDSLQKMYSGKIQIILITKNKKEKVDTLFSKIRIKKPTLPFVTNDSICHLYFPYRTIPHHVWIDSNGFVKYITAGWNATSQNIEKFLDGEYPSLAAKIEAEDFDWTIPLWIEGNGRQLEHLQYYSFIMNRISDFGGSIISYEDDSITKKPRAIMTRNVSILDHFRIAYSGKLRRELLVPSRTLLEMTDVEKYTRPKDMNNYERWADSNLFSYELKVPTDKEDEIYEMMKIDMERYFDLKGSIEKRKVRCLVLKSTASKNKLEPHTSKQLVDLSPDYKRLTVMNLPISNLIKQLEIANSTSKYPFIDETNITSNITVELNCDLKNMSIVNRELKKYGLQIISETKEVEMLVLKKRDKVLYTK